MMYLNLIQEEIRIGVFDELNLRGGKMALMLLLELPPPLHTQINK